MTTEEESFCPNLLPEPLERRLRIVRFVLASPSPLIVFVWFVWPWFIVVDDRFIHGFTLSYLLVFAWLATVILLSCAISDLKKRRLSGEADD